MFDTMDPARTFYRQLFLKRYALLLQKVEDTYPSIHPLKKKQLQEKILCLSWVDPAIDKLLRAEVQRSSDQSE
jgi:hypothetical protein